MIKNILGCNCPSAHIATNKLVLSLPDAVTPVMWVIDLNESKTVLLKVEQAENDLYVLQKVNPAKPGAEDIAYYDKKGKAIRALQHANDAISQSSSKKGGVLGCIWSLIKTGFFFFVIFLIALYLLLGTGFGTTALINMIEMREDGIVSYFSDNRTEQATATPAPRAQASVPTTPSLIPSNPNEITVSPTGNNPDEVGVPLSAEDFIQKRPVGF